jgi:hypothetical protein
MTWKNAPINFGFKVLEDADDFSKKVAGEMLAQVVTRSPVDSGAYRGNHRVGVNSVDTTADKSQTENTAIQRGVATIQAGGGLGKIVYISNSLPYATKIEFGHSMQAPNGVYALSFQSVVNKYK